VEDILFQPPLYRAYSAIVSSSARLVESAPAFIRDVSETDGESEIIYIPATAVVEKRKFFVADGMDESVCHLGHNPGLKEHQTRSDTLYLLTTTIAISFLEV